MDISFKLESFKNVADLALPLMENHYKETSIFAQQKPFKLNTALYFEHEANESFKFFTAYDGDKLVGYAGYFIMKHQHCDLIIAHQDGIYIMPEYRNNGLCKKMIDFADQLLCAFCVEAIVAYVPSVHDFSQLYLRNDYLFTDKVLIKGRA